MVVYALGALPGDAQIDTLRTALQDRRPTCDGTPPSRSRATATTRRAGAAADARPAVRRADVKRDVRQDDDRDPIADVMISGLRAAAALKDETLKPSVDESEPAGSQHESAPGGARGAEGDGLRWHG